QLVFGSDAFANAVQWLALIGTIIASSLVALRLGADRGGQLLAAAFVASTPIVLLEASSTQNDLVAAFWLVAFANYALDISASRSALRWSSYTLAGLSLGLALNTKGTAYIFALPVVALLVKAVVRSRAAAQLCAFAAAAVLLNVPYFAR